MKKLYNNALFYKDWRTSKWISIIMTINLFYFKTMEAFTLISLQKYRMAIDEKFVPNKMWFNGYLIGHNKDGYMISLILVALLTVLLFKGEKQNSTFELLYSMPFKRKEMILSKIKVGFLSIIIPFLVNFIIMTLFYIKNKAYIGSNYSDIPKFYFINLLMCLLFFIFLVFIQTIVGQYLIATITAPIILITPYVLVKYLLELVESTLRYSIYPKLWKLTNFYPNLNIYDIANYQNIPMDKVFKNGEWTYSNYKYGYESFGVKILVMIFLIMVFSLLSVIIYNRLKVEKINQLIIFKPAEKIFNLGVAIWCGIVVSVIFGDVYTGNRLRIYITLFLGAAIGYYISKLMIKLFSR
ncbi:ABC transporter permease [Clostridium brassicae]|uniref:ABC transporter permease subunit n=1 Tax=Clostridium brassicae TaxID=2999072 RepID=A0ABT4DBY4_9CLOT|nr:ABC transporter permease subunit [Clostridium brassicae]MCY6959816.1 ABC transporter permease subunit [Clostridium brassicae]